MTNYKDEMFHESTREVARRGIPRITLIPLGVALLAFQDTLPSAVVLAGFLCMMLGLATAGPYLGELVARASNWWATREYEHE